MNQAQTRLLKDRLLMLRTKKINEIYKPGKMPKAIAQAQQIVTRWEWQRDKQDERRAVRMNMAYNAALHALMFEDDVQKVRAAFEAFERSKP